MKNRILFLGILPSLLFFACSEKNEDLAKEVDKHGSVEVVMNSTTLDADKEVITISYKIWKNGVIVSEKINYDTVSTLEKKMMEIEDASGNVGQAMLPKNYDFFVTVQ